MADKERTPGIASSNASPDPKRLRKMSPDAQSHAPESPGQTSPSKPRVEESTTAAATPAAIPELPEEDDLLEANDDVDSAFGTDSSDSTSIASSMFEGYLENGRRYQTKREGEYYGPADEKQFQTMQAAHLMHVVLDSEHSNPYFRSPIPDTVQNILDIGTGTGIWCCEVADRYPSAYVQGVDLSPPPETWVPPNCKFEVDDVLKPWMFKQTFDFIHLRHMLGSFTDGQWKGVYKQAYENLAPGGWIEQLEPSLNMRCDDGTMNPEGGLGQWQKVIGGAAESFGRSFNTEEHMRARIEAAGFTNIHEKLYKCPIGDWAKHPVLKEAGKLNRIQFKEGAEGYTIFLLTKFGTPQPWSVDEVQVFLAMARQDMDNPKSHAYMVYKRVWAQKPYNTKPKEEKAVVQNVGAD